MKKVTILSSALMLMALSVCFSSCRKEEPLATPVSYANSPKALEYCQEHKSELLVEIFEKMAKDEGRPDPVVNNPDITREVLIPIGYDGLNVKGFLASGAYLDSIVVDSLIKKAVANNNRSALLISGSSSSGKTTALKKVPYLKELKKTVGFVSDQTFESMTTLTKMIAQLKANGFEDKDIMIVMIYCDAPTSFFLACSRLYCTGRAIAKEYFADFMYPLFAGRVQELNKNFGEVHPIILLDNAKFALTPLTDESEQTIGYTGADTAVVKAWVYYNPLAATAFNGMTKGVKQFSSDADLPQAMAQKDTYASHWYYELGTDLMNQIMDIVGVWDRGGKEPFTYSQTYLPWVRMDYDNVDWNLYPTDGPACPFYNVRNPEKARRSLTYNLTE